MATKPGDNSGTKTLQNQQLMDMASQGGIAGLIELFIAFLTGNWGMSSGKEGSFHQELFDGGAKVSAQDVINSPTFRQQFPDYKVPESAKGIDMSADLDFKTAQAIFDKPEHIDAAARTVVNIGIERTVEDMEARGVKYGFGDKSGTSAIDCSGLVQKALGNAFGMAEDGISLTGEDGKATISFDNADKRLLVTHSDGQIVGIGKESGMLRGGDVKMENLREGMVIGLDTGDRGWDRGRTLGVDHVGIVYRDTETGVMKFAQSSSSGDGVNIQDLDKWLESNTAQRSQLYAVDPVALAETSYEKKPEMVAEASADNTSRTATSAADEIDPDGKVADNTATAAFQAAASPVQPAPQPEPAAPAPQSPDVATTIKPQEQTPAPV
jgi:hypothetical protein